MPDIELVATMTDDADRTFYEPVVATVTGFSQFNEAQFSLSNIHGFWALSPQLQQKMGTPKKGTKAEWYLSTRPKSGPNAKPGSVYMDVMDVRKVPEGYEG